jgi:hypothetical protein
MLWCEYMESNSKKRSTSQSRKVGVSCDDKLVKQLSVRLSMDEYERIRSAAHRDGRTASNYLRKLIFDGKRVK